MRFEPVRWMTITVAVLTALLGTGALTDVLPVTVVGWLGLAVAVLTAVLGVLARNAVTPLAQPEDAEGRQLVPRA